MQQPLLKDNLPDMKNDFLKGQLTLLFKNYPRFVNYFSANFSVDKLHFFKK